MKDYKKQLGIIDPAMASRIKERPEFLNSMGKGAKNMEMHKVLGALPNLKSNECIPYKADEFIAKFGKCGKVNLIKFLRNSGIKFPRIVEDQGIFYIWRNEI